jgi:AAA15 family ATPase/GTPase
LNVKYGPNGIGKSTLAKAIAFNAEANAPKLDQLRQFKSRSNPTVANGPSVSGAESLKTISIFGEEYVSQFVFQRDENSLLPCEISNNPLE